MKLRPGVRGSLPSSAMALESLAPDQRAVVELILKQDRSYSDLAGLLGISDDAVRRRARAGVAMLGPPSDLSADQRGRVTDYLLGQEAEDERAGTAALLSNSPTARDWAHDVAGRLRPVAGRDLPELPAAPPPATPDETPARSSRLGGAILIVVCTVLLGSLVVWLLSRDDGNGSASDPASAAATATPTAAATPRSLAEIGLRAVGGSKAEGLMQVNATQAGQVGIVVVARDVEPSGQGEAYAVWLTDSRRKAFRIGFEAKDGGAPGTPAGTLAFSGPSSDIDPAEFTRALTRYDDLVVSLERSDKGSEPASVILRGSLKRLQGGD